MVLPNALLIPTGNPRLKEALTSVFRTSGHKSGEKGSVVQLELAVHHLRRAAAVPRNEQHTLYPLQYKDFGLFYKRKEIAPYTQLLFAQQIGRR